MDRNRLLKLNAKQKMNAYHTTTYEYKEVLKKQLKRLNIIKQILESIYLTTPEQTILDSKYCYRISETKRNVHDAISLIEEQLTKKELRYEQEAPNPLPRLQTCDSKFNERMEASRRLSDLFGELMQLNTQISPIEEMEIPY